MSVISIAEIETGVAAVSDMRRRERFSRVLEDVRASYHRRIAPIGEPEALAYLTVHRRLKAGGTTVDPPDALIAATAIANGWTVATRNIKHIERTGARTLNPWEYRP